MKQYIFKLKFVATLVVLTFCFSQQVRANSDYYAKVTATAIGPTGAGTVYAEGALSCCCQ